MKKQNPLRNQEGFTLVEIIAVLIILGILAAVAVPRYIDLEDNAKKRAVDAAVSELNGRESLAWADVKISPSGYTPAGDAAVWNLVASGTTPRLIDLGSDYKWKADPVPAGGGTFIFKGEEYTMSRTISTRSAPGLWRRQ